MNTTLDKFLNARRYNKATKDTKPITHTRIPRDGGDGGCWHIPSSDNKTLLNLIYNDMFKHGRIDHFTETQNQDNGPLLIDLDFHYDLQHNARYHTTETIDQLTEDIIVVIQKMYKVDADYKIFFLERPNHYQDKTVVKDGIHIIVGIQTNKAMRIHFRELFLTQLETSQTLKALPLTNDLDTVVDLAVLSGSSNWQMIGSCKPGREAYKLAHFYNVVDA